MNDQAEKLREIITNLKKKQINSKNYSVSNRFNAKTARTIAFTSGKGGVGKSNIAVNTAIALSKLDYKVALIDADLGLANVDVILGLSLKFSLADIMRNNLNITEVLSEGPCGIKFISGGSGVEELTKLNGEDLERFINNIGILDNLFDIILIDTGAGLSDSVLSFVMAANEVIIVTTPDPTAIMDAYALIKAIAARDNEKNINIIVNRADSIKEANGVLEKLILVSRKFLGIEISPLGFILYDDAIVRAVKLQQPFLLSSPNSQASRFVRDIALNLVEYRKYIPNLKSSGVKDFIKRLSTYFSG
ncbi:MAG TPA: MinD/ParA family protein [Clostridiales bacterium]|nr:MinD/ParA family protein [Clostridiales bacterium]